MSYRDVFLAELDHLFDEAWAEFVKEIHKENRKSNRRLFKLLTAIKGDAFVADLKKAANTINKGCRLRVAREPKGLVFGDRRWKTIPKIYVDQKTNSDGVEGAVYIPVKPDRYIVIYYQLHAQ